MLPCLEVLNFLSHEIQLRTDQRKLTPQALMALDLPFALFHCLVQVLEDILEQNTAGATVDVVAISSLPVLLQVIQVFQHLKSELTGYYCTKGKQTAHSLQQ